MQTKSLSMRRALSAALFVLLLSVVGSKNALAQNQVAVLQHEGDMSSFFGQYALSLAQEAAVDGDTITLSSGTFEGCTLYKAVTIHGAGCVADTISGIASTTIGAVTFSFQNDIIPIEIEGVFFQNSVVYYSTCRNLKFRKCYINGFYGDGPWGSYSIFNLYMIDCIVKSFNFRGSGLSIINCAIEVSLYEQSNMYDQNTIINSIMIQNDFPIANSTVYNSVISHGNNNSTNNSTFHNCIEIKLGETSLFEGQLNNTNMDVDSYDDVFETFTGTISFENGYQLKEEITTSFLGNDETEVGIYGGVSPYNTHPSYMIIKHCNVAGRTTEDNKLSVEIELNNGD